MSETIEHKERTKTIQVIQAVKQGLVVQLFPDHIVTEPDPLISSGKAAFSGMVHYQEDQIDDDVLKQYSTSDGHFWAMRTTFFITTTENIERGICKKTAHGFEWVNQITFGFKSK